MEGTHMDRLVENEANGPNALSEALKEMRNQVGLSGLDAVAVARAIRWALHCRTANDPSLNDRVKLFIGEAALTDLENLMV